MRVFGTTTSQLQEMVAWGESFNRYKPRSTGLTAARPKMPFQRFPEQV